MPTLSFFDLPPEIRNIIYKELLVHSPGLGLTALKTIDRWRISKSTYTDWDLDVSSTQNFGSAPVVGYKRYRALRNPLSPNLLLVSKRVHDEANAIMYGQPLHFANISTMSIFLASIGLDNRRCLRHVTTHSWTSDYGDPHEAHTASILLADSASSLELFRIGCPIDSNDWIIAPHTIYYAKSLADTVRLMSNYFLSWIHPFFEAVGRAHGHAAAALDIFDIEDSFFDQVIQSPRCVSTPIRENDAATHDEAQRFRRGFFKRLRTKLMTKSRSKLKPKTGNTTKARKAKRGRKTRRGRKAKGKTRPRR